jgi:hypothetical protein
MTMIEAPWRLEGRMAEFSNSRDDAANGEDDAGQEGGSRKDAFVVDNF